MFLNWYALWVAWSPHPQQASKLHDGPACTNPIALQLPGLTVPALLDPLRTWAMTEADRHRQTNTLAISGEELRPVRAERTHFLPFRPFSGSWHRFSTGQWGEECWLLCHLQIQLSGVLSVCCAGSPPTRYKRVEWEEGISAEELTPSDHLVAMTVGRFCN